MAIQVISTPRLLWDDVQLRFIGLQHPNGDISLFNALPAGGEIGYVLTRTGTGDTDFAWQEPDAGAVGAVPDGDKSGVTVSGGGLTWEVNAGHINTTRLGGDVTTQGKALLDDETAAAQRTTLGLGTSATLDVDTDPTLAANSGSRVPAQSAVKAYVDNTAASLSWKDAVRVATTTAGTLASDFENGDTVDGVVLATGDRILIKNQASAAANGVYTVNASGAPTRATDMDAGAEFVGATMLVLAGTANEGTQWRCSNVTAPNVGTDAITFQQTAVGGATYTADGSTLQLTGNQFSVKTAGIQTAQLGGDITTAGKALLDDANAAAQRTTLGLGTAATTATTDYAAAAHNHTASEVTSGTFNTARLGSGTADSSTFLRGDGTWQTPPSASSSSAVGLRFTFDNATGDADPGAGKFRFNSATQPNAERLFIDTTDADALDITAALKLIGEGSRLRIQSEATPAQYHEILVTGTVVASGYWKIEFEHVLNGTAIANGASCRLMPLDTARGYQGTLTGDITAVTRNADGSLDTVTINGCTWTQVYGTNGALTSETFGGLTRTYNYSAQGVFTGVSGNVERSGRTVIDSSQGSALTTALNSAGAAAAGFECFVSDLGVGGIALQWASDHWRPATSTELVLGDNRGDINSTTNGTANESAALRTFAVPGWINSAYSWMRGEYGATFTGTNDLKTIRFKYDNTSFSAHNANAGDVHMVGNTGRFLNKGATNSQIGYNLADSEAGFGDTSGALATATKDSTTNLNVTVTAQCANASDTAQLRWATLYWGAA